jgi:hypothetical protein
VAAVDELSGLCLENGSVHRWGNQAAQLCGGMERHSLGARACNATDVFLLHDVVAPTGIYAAISDLVRPMI